MLLLALALVAQGGAPVELAQEDTNRVAADLPEGGRAEFEVRIGEEGAQVRDGSFESWFADGTLRSRGKYRDDRKVGRWETWHPNGKQARLEHWKRGLRNGDQKEWREDGSFLLKEVFKAEFEPYADGTPRWEGESLDLRDDVRHGAWRWFWPDGALRCEGTFFRSLPDGCWTWYWPDGVTRQFSGRFERQREDGEWVVRRVGEWTFWHANGCQDRGFFSGDYGEGERVAAQSEAAFECDGSCARPLLQSPAFDPKGGPGALREAARALANWLTTRGTEAPTATRGELEEFGAGLIPAVLIGWFELDLARPAEARVARTLASLLPRDLSLGEWRDGTDPESVCSNQRLRLRWYTLWEFLCASGKQAGDLGSEPAEALLATLFAPEPEHRKAYQPTTSQADGTEAAMQARWLLARSLGAGGQESSAGMLSAALEWLANAQSSNGSWQNEIGTTGLAVLALSEGGSSIESGPYAETLAEACNWLIKRQSNRTGWLGEGTSPRDHAIATLALCSAVQGASESILQKYTDFALHCVREPRRAVPGNDEASGWIVATLVLTKEQLGREVVAEDLAWADGWIASRTAESTAQETLDLWCRQLVGQTPNDTPAVREGVDRLRSKLPDWTANPPGMRSWFTATQALYQCGGRDWQEWNAGLTDHLAATQNGDGNLRGSWDPTPGENRASATALGALCLSVYARSPLRW